MALGSVNVPSGVQDVVSAALTKADSFKVGDILTTVRNPGEDWHMCDGSDVGAEGAKVINFLAGSVSHTNVTLPIAAGSIRKNNLRYMNGYWVSQATGTGKIAYTTNYDSSSWSTATIQSSSSYWAFPQFYYAGAYWVIENGLWYSTSINGTYTRVCDGTRGNAVVYNGNIYCAYHDGYSSLTVLKVDPVTKTRTQYWGFSTTDNYTYHSLSVANGKLILIYNISDGSISSYNPMKLVATSDDFATTETASLPRTSSSTDNGAMRVCYTNGKYVLATGLPNKRGNLKEATSLTGTWTTIDSGSGFAIETADGRVAVWPYNGTFEKLGIYNGTSWETHTRGATVSNNFDCGGIATDGSKIVMVFKGGNMVYGKKYPKFTPQSIESHYIKVK